MQLFNPFRTSCGLFHLFVVFFAFFRFNLLYIPRHLTFSVPGDCDFLVYCIILPTNTYIKGRAFLR